jgi:hypothetical protein
VRRFLKIKQRVDSQIRFDSISIASKNVSHRRTIGNAPLSFCDPKISMLESNSSLPLDRRWPRSIQEVRRTFVSRPPLNNTSSSLARSEPSLTAVCKSGLPQSSNLSPAQWAPRVRMQLHRQAHRLERLFRVLHFLNFFLNSKEIG